MPRDGPRTKQLSEEEGWPHTCQHRRAKERCDLHKEGVQVYGAPHAITKSNKTSARLGGHPNGLHRDM